MSLKLEIKSQHKQFTACVAPKSTISDLKTKCSATLHIKTASQSIIFNNDLCKDECTLLSLGIKNGSSLLLIDHELYPESINDTCSLFIFGYIRQTIGIRKNDEKILSILYLISELIRNHAFSSLTINRKSKYELYPSSEFFFDRIVIGKNAILTSRNQGIIGIQCFDLLMEENAIIHLNGRGYPGALAGCQGGSHSGHCGIFSKSDNSANLGGGGAGILFGGGGGYGSKGKGGDERYQYKSGIGGKCYGDAYLDYKHKFAQFFSGSGGGGGYSDGVNDKNTSMLSRGGNGGGGLYINVYGNLLLGKQSKIMCNGNNGLAGVCGGGGGGSGGSVLIEIHKQVTMHNTSVIQATGGKGGTKECGDGGYGRIRIKTYNQSQKTNINVKCIKPRPLID